MITVVVPYYAAAGFVDLAVRSILSQTYRDLRCVVIGDGETPPVEYMRDPRLVIYTLPQNHGTYYATAVALAACDTEWFSIHAADDWSERDRFARLITESDDVDVVFGGSVEHRGDRVSPRPVRFRKAGQRPVHVGSIATGIFRTEALRAFGWWAQPEYRVGYDSMMVNLALRVLRWRHIPGEYGYHRVIRGDSLTRDPATGIGSKYRHKSNVRRDALWNRVVAAPQDQWPALLAPSPELAVQVAADAERLRKML